jgi:ribosomal protein L24E
MRNQYAGTCYRCGEPCEAGQGHFERVPGKGWRVQHAGCARLYRGKKGPAEVRAHHAAAADDGEAGR